jgi:hypothetical protein
MAVGVAPARAPLPASNIVDAEDHDSFWLWAGVRPQPAMERAKRLYILQGEVRAPPPVQLVSRRSAVPRVAGSDVWMVVRVETLAWPPHVTEQLLRQLSLWRAAGNRVVGVQIDFDARTRHLHTYAAFLETLRRRLPPGTKLGITGLLDWSANGDPAGLAALAGTVDEAVLQIYQGRRVIPGYRAYLANLGRMTMPFRIGLLQGGEWQPPADLAENPHFQGYVVFLQNPPGAKGPVRRASTASPPLR